ncbi:hypothetical protein JIN85_17835 [Luteolibacter pohnpeiensis]|uniref:Uncharacterized protein n=1 Tax=Luteolibacter pohnpeiensis TaxID=454153 RepID=A0A934VXE7_9BACT|nr:hypothetical protein [Luteolibacter pohnpeiensis]MBK1884285.1 hypothetical protein [Luteolibacter pohnpeiensis]
MKKLEEMFSGELLFSGSAGRHLLCLSLSPGLPPPARFASVLNPLSRWKMQEGCGCSDGEEGAGRLKTAGTTANGMGDGMPPEALTVLKNTALRLSAERPEAVLRIYLDPLWEESEEELVEAGCQVVRMVRPSEGPNPAALWRFLALEEDSTVTFLSLDDLGQAKMFLERTTALQAAGLKFWRSPMDLRRDYRPIHPDRFGCLQGLPVRELLLAYMWYLRKAPPAADAGGKLKTQPLQVKVGERQPLWEGADLAEFFLLSAVYPRLAFEGVLTLIEADDQHSRWLALDIEYVTWANPASELFFVKPLHPSISLKPVDLKESTLVPSMLERLALENRYPEHFAAWTREEMPGNPSGFSLNLPETEPTESTTP